MPIKIECTCGAVIVAKDEKAGKGFQCPKCGERLVVPTATLPDEESEPDETFPAFETDEVGSDEPFPPFESSGVEMVHRRRSKTVNLASIATNLTSYSTHAAYAALLISLVTLVWTFSHDPLGSGIGSYDFTTPKASLISSMKISMNNDIRANIEIDQLRTEKQEKEQFRTLKVHKESDYQSYRILFVSYDENGIKKYETRAFEKHTDSGYWFPAYLSTYDVDDSVLKNAMEDWGKKGGVVEEEEE